MLFLLLAGTNISNSSKYTVFNETETIESQCVCTVHRCLGFLLIIFLCLVVRPVQHSGPVAFTCRMSCDFVVVSTPESGMVGRLHWVHLLSDDEASHIAGGAAFEDIVAHTRLSSL